MANMNGVFQSLTAAGALLALSGVLVSGDAQAAAFRVNYYSATAVCEAPLPSYDVDLRKRPLGITNQGSSVIFISCSVPGDFYGDTTSNSLYVYFESMGAGGTVNCTAVAGSRVSGSGSVASSTTVTAGGSSFVNWTNLSKTDPYGSFNFSCNVTPDIEMNLILIRQNDAAGEI